MSYYLSIFSFISKEYTTFEMLYLPDYMENGRVNPRGGVALRNVDGSIVSAKPLGSLGVSERRSESDTLWQPTPAEVFHLVPLVNRPSIACYSPLACAFLAPTSSSSSTASARRPSFGSSSMVDCTNCTPHQWFLRHLISGTVQFFTSESSFTAFHLY